MSQVFHRSMNTVARVVIIGAVLFAASFVGVVYAVFRSPYTTGQNVTVNQPVQFSHEHHTNALGIDCRYCHTGTEQSWYGGVPPTETCMSCHSQIWRDSKMLEPVRDSLRKNEPIRWNLVHDLPDYVYFNHSVHVNKGVGCASCHGKVNQMPLIYRASPLTMEWCLNCHRNPEKYLRPQEEIYNMNWTAGSDAKQVALGLDLIKKNHVPVHRLSDCSTCHR